MSKPLNAYSTVITATVRQSYHLRETVLSGASDTFVTSLGQFIKEKMPLPLNKLLSDIEEKDLWERIIAKWQSDNNKELVNLSSTARLAKQAFEMIVKYQLPINADIPFMPTEVAVMKKWMASYLEALARRDVITPCLREANVIRGIISGDIVLPDNTALYGFTLSNKLESELLNFSKTANIPLVEPPMFDADVSVSLYTEQADEINAAAHWIKAEMEKDASQKIGIVVMGLPQRKHEIQRIFDQVLVPESVYHPLTPDQRPYRLSMGQSLLEFPVVSAFFDVFKMRLSGKVLLNEISNFIRNPLIGGARQEYLSRAKLDVQLRKLDSKKISWSTLKQMASTELKGGQATSYYSPDLLSRMEAHESLFRSQPRGRLTGEQLGNVLYQVSQIWFDVSVVGSSIHGPIMTSFLGNEENDGLLSMFINMINGNHPIGLLSGIKKFRDMAKETQFQPPSNQLSVQVISENDALGIPFDAVWVLGATANEWPRRAQPNPLLLPEWLTEYGVPHASAEQELQYARFIESQLIKTSKKVVFSSYLQANGEEVKASPLILKFKENTASNTPVLTEKAELLSLISRSKVQVINDNDAPSISDDGKVAGGTGLFKSQALCPFKGFVEYRLGIRPIEEPEVGLSARLRGDLLHTVFENFWKEVEDQETLKRLELEGNLKQTVLNAIRISMETFAYRKPDVFTPRIVEVESKRLAKLTTQWMREIELARAPFSQVQVETAHNVTIGGLDIKVKMDHRDVNEDGGVNIADNKTGAVTADDWFGERLLEPQVPLYALVEADANNKINSVAFKGIKQDALKVKGVAVDSDTYPKIQNKAPSQMKGILDNWRIQINSIAQEFKSGKANIAPSKVSKSCQYCELKSACRFHNK